MTTFGELCCEVCGVSGSVTAMHRNNPKGEPGQWRCAPHLDKPADAEVLRITDAVQLGVDPRSLPDVVVVEHEEE